VDASNELLIIQKVNKLWLKYKKVKFSIPKYKNENETMYIKYYSE